MRLSDLPPGVSVNDPHINPGVPKRRRPAAPGIPKATGKGSRDLNRYIRANLKAQAIGKKIEARRQKYLAKMEAEQERLRIQCVNLWGCLSGGQQAQASRLLGTQGWTPSHHNKGEQR